MATIGKQIRAICAIINAQGPMTYRQVAEQLPMIQLTNVHKCLQRACIFSIVICNEKVYNLSPDWKNTIEQYEKLNRKPKIVKKKKIINSVWSLANV